ncbi:MAG: hypothetical protein AB7U73_22480, partial [Pirellulales bacterium]
MLRSRLFTGLVVCSAIAGLSLCSVTNTRGEEPASPSQVIQNLIATLNNQPPGTPTSSTTPATPPAPAPAPAPPVVNPEPAVNPAPPASAADGVLTYDNFPAFAANLGYECKKIS